MDASDAPSQDTNISMSNVTSNSHIEALFQQAAPEDKKLTNFQHPVVYQADPHVLGHPSAFKPPVAFTPISDETTQPAGIVPEGNHPVTHAIQPITQSPCERRSASAPPFVIKLRQLLNDPKYSGAICWSSDGTTVNIFKQKFQKEILGKVFKTTKYKSFVRQLNLHGFRQISGLEGPRNETMSFYCRHFVQDDPFGEKESRICRRVRRNLKKSSLNPVRVIFAPPNMNMLLGCPAPVPSAGGFAPGQLQSPQFVMYDYGSDRNAQLGYIHPSMIQAFTTAKPAVNPRQVVHPVEGA